MEKQQSITQKALNGLMVCFIILVFYGSCMPFDLTLTQDEAMEGIGPAFEYWPMGDRPVSKTDLASNLILYVPLGLLCGFRFLCNGRSNTRTLIQASLMGLGLSLLVEYTQLYSPTRESGVQDLLMNTLGAAVGSWLAVLIGIKGLFWIEKKGQTFLKTRPIAVLAILLAGVLAADAWFPFLPTIDVSSVNENFKNAIRSLEEGLAVHGWGYWLVRQAGVYLVLAGLLACGFPDKKTGNPSWYSAAGLACLVAMVLEGGKFFIQGRTANIANIAVACVGAGLSPLIGPPIRKWLSGVNRFAVTRGVLWCYVVFLELAPGESSVTGDLSNRLPSGTEWLPFYHYAMTGRGEKVILLLQTLLPVAAMTIAKQLSHQPLQGTVKSRAVTCGLLAGLLGAILEILQLWIPHRYPATGDVLAFAMAGVLGSLLADAYLKLVGLPNGKTPVARPILKKRSLKFRDPNDIRNYRF